MQSPRKPLLVRLSSKSTSSHWLTLLLSMLLVFTAATSSVKAISDPGVFEPEPEPEPEPGKTPPEAAPPPPKVNGQWLSSFTGALSSPPPPELNALLPLLYSGNRVSLPHGCYRTTDLLSRSSLNPWSADFMNPRAKPRSGTGSFSSSSSSSLPPHLRSDLVLCPLHKSPAASTADSDAYKFYSVSGIIEVAPGLDIFSQDATALRQHLNAPLHPDVTLAREPTATTPAWPQIGEETGGFWRQRDGQPEWEPQPTDPMPLVAPNDVSAASSTASPDNVSHGSGTHSSPPGRVSSPLNNEHAEAYDAWSASIGGESAEEWLSFAEWRERHLAAEKEKAEAERRAEGKHKRQRAKHTQHTSATGNASSSSSHNDSRNGEASKAANRTHGSEATHTSVGGSRRNSDVANQTNQSNQSANAPTASGPDSGAVPVEDPSASNSSREASSSPTSAAMHNEQAVDPVSSNVASEALPQVIPAIRDASDLLRNLKHRWNFASMDCAALVHRTNPSAKFASSILSEKKDRYMLSPCPDVSKDSHGNFVVVELCDEISIDTIVLANYEFFSRMFKRFKVSVAQTLKGGGSKDVEDWYELGVFRARNLRGVQVFNTTLPPHSGAPTRFFRYIRIDFLEYYGNEYYCPLSLLRVYGLTQMDDYRREEEEERKALEASKLLAISDSDSEDLDDEEGIEFRDDVEIPEELRPVSDGAVWDSIWKEQDLFASAKKPWAGSEGNSFFGTHAWPAESAVDTAYTDHRIWSQHDQPSPLAATHPSTTNAASQATVSAEKPLVVTDQHASFVSSGQPAYIPVRDRPPGPSAPVIPTKVLPSICVNTPMPPLFDNFRPVVNTSMCSLPRASTFKAAEPIAPSASTAAHVSASNGQTRADKNSPHSPATSTPSAARQDKHDGSNATVASSGSESARPSHGSSGGAAAGTSTESIYRTITKRLNALEANATLSMQYIEHSGQMLREVFKAMERRQEGRLGDMLRALNSSNWRQIEALKRRQQVELQRAIFEFDVHRQQTEAERRALLSEVRMLTSEVMFERRLGVVQLILVLALFVFMALTRGPTTSPSALHSGLAKLAAASASPKPNIQKGLTAVGSHPNRANSGPQLPVASGETSAGGVGEGSTPKATAVRLRPSSAMENRDKRGEQQRFAIATDQAPQQSDEARAETPSEAEGEAKDVRLTREPSYEDEHEPATVPAADFAEMSPAELRSYLGFSSPTGPRASSPHLDYDGRDASLPYEAASEGVETAMEDLESEADEFDEAMSTIEHRHSPLMQRGELPGEDERPWGQVKSGDGYLRPSVSERFRGELPRRAASADMTRSKSMDSDGVSGLESIQAQQPVASPQVTAYQLDDDPAYGGDSDGESPNSDAHSSSLNSSRGAIMRRAASAELSLTEPPVPVQMSETARSSPSPNTESKTNRRFETPRVTVTVSERPSPRIVQLPELDMEGEGEEQQPHLYASPRSPPLAARRWRPRSVSEQMAASSTQVQAMDSEPDYGELDYDAREISHRAEEYHRDVPERDWRAQSSPHEMPSAARNLPDFLMQSSGQTAAESRDRPLRLFATVRDRVDEEPRFSLRSARTQPSTVTQSAAIVAPSEPDLPVLAETPAPSPSPAPAARPQPPPYATLISGAASGLASCVLLQPLDLLKTRLQQADSQSARWGNKTQRLIATTRGVLEKDGPKGLWRGTWPTILRNVPGVALYFYSITELRRLLSLAPIAYLSSAQPTPALGPASPATPAKPTAAGNLIAGATARVSVGFILCPITVVKARFESSNFPAYTERSAGSVAAQTRNSSTLLNSLRSIYVHEGVRGLFRGFTATALRDAPHAGLYLMFYEKGKTLCESCGLMDAPSDIWKGRMLSGALAGTLATVVTHPFDIIKTRLQTTPVPAASSNADATAAAASQTTARAAATFRSTVAAIYASGGVSSLFLDGLGLRCARKAASSAIAWGIFEAGRDLWVDLALLRRERDRVRAGAEDAGAKREV